MYRWLEGCCLEVCGASFRFQAEVAILTTMAALPIPKPADFAFTRIKESDISGVRVEYLLHDEARRADYVPALEKQYLS